MSWEDVLKRSKVGSKHFAFIKQALLDEVKAYPSGTEFNVGNPSLVKAIEKRMKEELIPSLENVTDKRAVSHYLRQDFNLKKKLESFGVKALTNAGLAVTIRPKDSKLKRL